MPTSANQHFVPQYYFRQFTGGRRCIHILLRASGRTLYNAPIRGQCARRSFYGPEDVEAAIGRIENCHCGALRAAISVAWKGEYPDDAAAYIDEAVIFQRARTRLQVAKINPALEQTMQYAATQYLKVAPGVDRRDELVEAMESRKVRVVHNEDATLWHEIHNALEGVPLVSDLHFLLIRNHTDYPFIFSDAPVVFHNSYCRSIVDRGVLGLQSPGLQICFPLDPSTAIFMLDRDAYDGIDADQLYVDVTARADVSQLNALQLHHSHHAVYYGDDAHTEYVSSLWLAHHKSLRVPRAEFRVRSDVLVDGKTPDGEVMHMFEPQLNLALRLSFVTPKPLPEVVPYVRSSELAEPFMQREPPDH